MVLLLSPEKRSRFEEDDADADSCWTAPNWHPDWPMAKDGEVAKLPSSLARPLTQWKLSMHSKCAVVSRHDDSIAAGLNTPKLPHVMNLKKNA
ncbi:hypothetical protein E4U35_006777 [Claviceps purpurea]|nr:hypothetical protein E4U10_006859 [Claviceps purpurea]KAG6199212.1 hypothetical protein E4U35_006777 [Claviceps purpurea]